MMADVSDYDGKKVVINLKNSQYYKGIVLKFEEKGLIIRDIRDKLVWISLDEVIDIREVDDDK